MTEQEQIEEMCEAIASMICQIYNPQCDEYEPHTCSHCYANDTLIGDFAEMLYNAGYRKVDDLKSENKQLKTECALLDDELRIARQETIDVLNKVKEGAVGLAAIETYHICNLIDELLKGYEK